MDRHRNKIVLACQAEGKLASCDKGKLLAIFFMDGIELIFFVQLILHIVWQIL